MSCSIVQKQVILHFSSIEAISQFKNKTGCACSDFYIDRDAMTITGSFTEEQATIAVEQFGAQTALIKI
jgi:hypothetical protein